ncbi:membrane protein [Micromonospora pattaloongensis]|uniref:Membrane protein n=1 Tax=Micromonospora pattaloongensis TaxID=405436 RepID=A0A1H3GHL8_9ACTN|nr:YhjD/YihY/BrkB family envelope integrity protein [Micromonospora pattaloongensis]SDY02781.1 membrane protein [Micromonospora pattaloongensis]
MNVIARATAAWGRAVAARRRRSPGFDHFCRALGRYNEVMGGRLAAAIAYYGFFAIFALVLVAYSVFGFVLKRNVALQIVVQDFVRRYLPFVELREIGETSGTVGVIGVIGLILTGIGWVEAIRSSQRLIHRLEQQPGNVLIRRVIDLAALVAVLVLIGTSVAAVDLLTSLLRGAVGERGPLLAVIGWLMSLLVNLILATALMVVVPRLRMPPRRLRWPVWWVGFGITLLNTLGRGVVGQVERNPAYTVVAGAVGVLVYLYLLNQLLLFGAALLATSAHGRVGDLARGRRANSGDLGQTART